MSTSPQSTSDARRDPRFAKLLQKLGPKLLPSPEETMLSREERDAKVEMIIEKLLAESGSFFVQMLEGDSDEEIAQTFHLEVGMVPHWRVLILSYAKDIAQGVF